MNNIKVYGLFHGVNAYDQEGDYLRFVWFSKPTINECAEAMGWSFPDGNDETILKIVALYKGESIKVDYDNYSISEIKPGQQ